MNGDNAHPLYAHLKKAKPGIFGTTGVKWNFTKVRRGRGRGTGGRGQARHPRSQVATHALTHTRTRRRSHASSPPQFLVDRQGNVVERYSPTTTPSSIAKDVERLLK